MFNGVGPTRPKTVYPVVFIDLSGFQQKVGTAFAVIPAQASANRILLNRLGVSP
jgi:hypothetical protein